MRNRGFRTVAAATLALLTTPMARAEDAPPQIVVTASRQDLLGAATTASQGTISRAEVELRPIYRAGQVFESVPGLVVTIHSGEGKAQQYLVRGYNLDHGTDLAQFVDDMPVNRPTNAHGQGYADLNFLMPRLIAAIDFTKGPYFAQVGDFGAVASAHARLIDDAPTQVAASIGSDGTAALFAAATVHTGQGQRLLAAADIGLQDGPWQPGQHFRRINGLLRTSTGSPADGLSVTAMAYASDGGLITDQPARAVTQGLIGRLGTLDPTDHSQSGRYSLSARLARPVGPGQLVLNLYAIRATMTLWNDFTHALDDPVNGDQEEQDEQRTTLGFGARYAVKARLAGLDTETEAGLQLRRDAVAVDRKHTRRRTLVLGTCYQEQANPAADASGDTIAYGAAGGNCTADRVHLLMASPYVQETVHWASWLRTIAGLRADYQHATDRNLVRAPAGPGGNQGSPIAAAQPAEAAGGQWLVQPKASLAIGPWAQTELYASYGTGFHSNDVRGVFGFAAGQNTGGTRLLSRTTGFELGLRSSALPRVNLEIALFRQDFSSELSYNADVGSDDANGPSRRQGLELSARYHPVRWLELNTNLAFARARYRCPATGSSGGPCAGLGAPANPGNWIANAPGFIGSAGLLVHALGPWSGAAQWRRLGPHPLVDGGPLTDGRPWPWQPGIAARGGGYSEWNLELGRDFAADWHLQLAIYNLFDSQANAADYYYQSRLPGEPAHGFSDFQVHPIEPRSARITLTRRF